ncbi:hypothetical protein OGATHE_000879 [Ogataea polymorpha]|uniref:Uncharacterized protein n=1 Tax=Ogataea polymorpha TaxID=460523 RepID=A0A9P8TG60_9ASCO|nr:hypothetical protein OGATHE_000879 [Ogataea polymorpha]
MAEYTTLRTLSNILSTPWKNIATMTTPFRASVCDLLKSMRNSVIELCFFWRRICAGSGNALINNVLVALLMAQKSAIFTLESTVSEEIATNCTAHDVVELLLDELVAVVLVNFLFSLTNGTMTSQATSKSVPFSFAVFVGLCETDSDQYLTRRFQLKPASRGHCV